jgi:uncharacterized membrane protein
MAKKQIHKTSKKDHSDSKLFALLGVLLTIVGYIVVMVARKDDKYAVFYAKQGLVLFIAWVIAAIASWIVGWIPVSGGIIGWILNAIILAFWIVGIIYSISGEEKEIPIIGEFARKI